MTLIFSALEPLTQELVRVLFNPNIKPSKSGWYRCRCPACGDTHPNKMTASFLLTESGGFRFLCHVKNCEFHKATGWEADGVIGSRVEALFDLLYPPFLDDLAITD